MIRRGVAALLCLTFVFFAAVQYNDPDPYVWIPVYGAAALLCGLEVAGRAWWPGAAALAAGTLAWAATIVPRVWGHTNARDLFMRWEMRGGAAEEGREMFGLVIVAASMTFVALAARRRQARAAAGGGGPGSKPVAGA
ncbi:MAG TPA: transmembrane 220 family protein [Myxococcota bacterium]|jgi:hypothetical protein|nr:transmembrane 220 family protein [Myxococcota bacterium]